MPENNKDTVKRVTSKATEITCLGLPPRWQLTGRLGSRSWERRSSELERHPDGASQWSRCSRG